MTEIYLHIFARMADYILPRTRIKRSSLSQSINRCDGPCARGCGYAHVQWDGWAKAQLHERAVAETAQALRGKMAEWLKEL